jgi:glycerol-3-phosphate dehydrogenase (NAD(P)+)
VLTLALGIARGIGCSENTIAFIATLGVKQIQKLMQVIGARAETLYEPCGIGDIFLTAFGAQSRNGQAGILLGQGKSLTQIQSKLAFLPEGINSTISFYKFCNKKRIELSLITATYKIIQGTLPLESFVSTILDTDNQEYYE